MHPLGVRAGVIQRGRARRLAPGDQGRGAALATIALVLAVTWGIAAAGDTAPLDSPAAHVAYLAIVIAAAKLGALPALITALAAAVVVSPLAVPAEPGTEPAAWWLQLALFVLLGQTVALLGHRPFAAVQLVQEWTADGRQRAELEEALSRDEFSCVYQPLFDLSTGTLTGVEALVRWRHPARGTLAPQDFVPAAERTGLIVELGLVVLRQACAQAAAWRSELPPGTPFKVGVNLSARQLEQSDLTAQIAAVLSETGLPANALELEITETAVISDFDAAVARLTELHRLGVGIAVDDFGTGQSSLSYLHRFRPQVIKVDRSFVHALDDGRAEAVAAGIIRLASSLDATCVAEGIETEVQADRLRALGCRLGQGYFYARPSPPEDITRILPMALRSA